MDLEALEKEVTLTRLLANKADEITTLARSGVRREFAANGIAEAATNVLSDQLRTGNGLSREWTKTVINLAIIAAQMDETELRDLSSNPSRAG